MHNRASFSIGFPYIKLSKKTCMNVQLNQYCLFKQHTCIKSYYRQLIIDKIVISELRQSRQSLAVSERMSRVSYPSVATHTRQRSRSRSRDHTGTAVPRPGSRYSTAGSHYGDQDNWTDHDMDIYMARNTTRSGLVPL